MLSPELITETATYLTSAITKGFKKPIYTEPDIRMVQSLLNNTWQFAGFKINSQATHISTLLVDEQGLPRSFDSFKKEADKVGIIYNHNWLRTEHQHAIAASQAAAKWVDIQANKKALPLLQYDTAGDDRVRPKHAALNGITLPVEHEFWIDRMPPWDWACRCTARQLAGGRITDKNKVDMLIEKAGKSRFKNIGITGKAFPDDMPFFHTESIKEKDAVNALVMELSAQPIKETKIALKQQVYASTVEKQYKTIDTFENGGKVQRHVFTPETLRDWQDVYGIAKEKAAQGSIAKILPEIDKAEKEARNKLMPGHIGNTNADLLVDGKLVEVEKTSQYKNINRRIAAAAKQANHVCIIYTEADENFKLGKNTKKIFKDLPNLEMVEFYNSNFEKIAELKPYKIKKGK